jgi:hypothetical protein
MPRGKPSRKKSDRLYRSRIESFCAAVGLAVGVALTPSDYVPRYVVRDEEPAWAKSWLGAGTKPFDVAYGPERQSNGQREHKCRPPCMMFEWLGCDNQCWTQGCEIIQKIRTEDVVNGVQTLCSTGASGRRTHAGFPS